MLSQSFLVIATIAIATLRTTEAGKRRTKDPDYNIEELERRNYERELDEEPKEAQDATSDRGIGEYLQEKLFGTFEETDVLPEAPKDLRYAFIIFRHGIRSPFFSPFQSFLDFQKMWGIGIGGILTTRGRRLMMHVGESLATRYKKVVPHYDKDVVHFTSTRVTRAKKSAHCVATGLFTVDDPVFKNKKRRDLIPCKALDDLQTVSFDKCYLYVDIKFYKLCNIYTQMRKQTHRREKEQISDMRKDYYHKLNHCIHDSYKKPNFAKKLSHSATAFDTFQAWVLDEQRSLEHCIAAAMPVLQKTVQLHLWHEIHSKDYMVQYYIGIVVYTILSEMGEAKALAEKTNGRGGSNNAKKRLKMHFHGSHDVTVSPLVWVLSQVETYYALTGDTLMIEMTSDNIVQVFLYSPLGVDKRKRFQHLSLQPLCGKEDCTFDEFKSAMDLYSYDEETWKKMCKDTSKLHSGFRPLPHDIDHEDLEKLTKSVRLIQKNKSVKKH